MCFHVGQTAGQPAFLPASPAIVGPACNLCCVHRGDFLCCGWRRGPSATKHLEHSGCETGAAGGEEGRCLPGVLSGREVSILGLTKLPCNTAALHVMGFGNDNSGKCLGPGLRATCLCGACTLQVFVSLPRPLWGRGAGSFQAAITNNQF